MTEINTREIMVECLTEILERGAYSHLVLQKVLTKYQYLEKRQRAFLTRTVQGTLERKIELDAVLDQFSSTPVKKMKPFIRTLLRMWNTSFSDQEVYLITTTYIMVFSLILSNSLLMFISRFISDCIYEDNKDQILPSFFCTIAYLLVLGGIIAVIYLALLDTPSVRRAKHAARIVGQYRTVDRNFGFGFFVPWGSVVIAVAAVYLVVGITMLYGSRKVRKQNIIDGLRQENI